MSRQVRHTRRGIGGSTVGFASPSQSPTVALDPINAAVRSKLATSVDGLTMQDLDAAFPEVSQSSLIRALRELQDRGVITRVGIPRSRDARYR